MAFSNRLATTCTDASPIPVGNQLWDWRVDNHMSASVGVRLGRRPFNRRAYALMVESGVRMSWLNSSRVPFDITVVIPGTWSGTNQ